MPHVDPALEQLAQANPDASFPIIVRVEGDMDARQAELETAELTITRRLWLIRGFACTASGSAIATVAAHEWVVSIEPDQSVQTMNSAYKE